MKHKTSYQDKNQKIPESLQPDEVKKMERDAREFVPAPDEIARKAYFSYENEGSRPGRDVQHWLKAEEDLTAERNLTRVHGFHNQT